MRHGLINHQLRTEIVNELRRRKPEYFGRTSRYPELSDRNDENMGVITKTCVEVCELFVERERAEKRELLARIEHMESLLNHPEGR